MPHLATLRHNNAEALEEKNTAGIGRAGPLPEGAAAIPGMPQKAIQAATVSAGSPSHQGRKQPHLGIAPEVLDCLILRSRN